MMGMCLYELDTPVTKTTNAILAFGEKADKKRASRTDAHRQTA